VFLARQRPLDLAMPTPSWSATVLDSGLVMRGRERGPRVAEDYYPYSKKRLAKLGVGWMDGLMSQRVGYCGVLEGVHAVVMVLEASRRTTQPS